MHMESVDVLVSEGAQQDMDLKSAFVPAVPRHPFFRILLGDPRQSPGGVADNLREPDPPAQGPNWPASKEQMADATRTAEDCL